MSGPAEPGDVMLIGVLKEQRPGETRVAATPATVAQLLKLGYDVVVDPGAGDASSFSDEAYVEAGCVASVTRGRGRRRLRRQRALEARSSTAMAPRATLVSLLSPRLDPELVEDLGRRPITAMSMDAVPRISRAQSLDVLSSMANIAGYRAVVEAAHVFGRFFTGQVTAAGKVPAGEGAGRRCRRRGPGGDRRGRQHGCDRARDGPAARGRRPGQVAGRGVPLRRGRRRRGLGHGLRQGDVRRLQHPRGRACTPSRPRTSTSSSPRP